MGEKCKGLYCSKKIEAILFVIFIELRNVYPIKEFKEKKLLIGNFFRITCVIII